MSDCTFKKYYLHILSLYLLKMDVKGNLLGKNIVKGQQMIVRVCKRNGAMSTDAQHLE